jgi:hypothetical protein
MKMKHFRLSKKVLVSGVALTVALVGGGIAFAYFAAGGSGLGSAKVGSVNTLSITQVGAGYDSLVSSGNYVQDQTYGGAGVEQFGNDIKLATTGELSDVVVAFRSWETSSVSFPITLNIYDPSNLSTPIAYVTQSPTFQPATGPNTPTLTNVTFDFSSQDITLPTEIVYGISYDPLGAGSGVNVALSNAATNLTVGQDTYPGNVDVEIDPAWNGGNIGGWQVDAGTCSVPSVGSFTSINVYCGANSNPENAGAYENAQGADIPAVEFNVVGGAVPALYPGDPAQNIGYAITNPGSAQQVNSVSVAIAYDPSNDEVQSTPGDVSTDVAGCYVQWFQVNNSPQTLNYQLPANSTTLFGTTMQASVAGNELSIQMPANSGTNQDDCENATLALVFTSN